MANIPNEDAYAVCLVALKQEHDFVEPELRKLEERISALKQSMLGLSRLLHVELEDKYRYPPLRNHGTYRGKSKGTT